MHGIEVVTVATALVGTLLQPNSRSHALSSGVSQYAHGSQSLRRRSPSSSRKYPLLAVAENHEVSEACREVNDVVFTVSPGSIPSQQDGIEPGEVGNTSISAGMTVIQENSRNLDCPSKNVPMGSLIRSVIAKSAVLHRAGMIGARPSQAKVHLNKNRKHSGKTKKANAITRVLGTVHTAAVAVLAEEKQSISLTSEPFTWNLTSAIESTVVDMMKFRDIPVNQQSVNVLPFIESPPLFPPAGTTSMGILGDVVQDKLPEIPPFPGTHFLSSAIGDGDDSQITIRTSIPHSSDDTHIASLRLSVFSQFDEEKQQLFRRQSIEVLNSRRKRGAVVLVAETRKGESRSDYPYLNEMQSRIVNGHKYGEKGTRQSGQKSIAISLDSQTFVDVSSLQTKRGSIIGSVECSHQEFRGTILGNLRPKGSLMYVTEVAVRVDARRCGAGAMLMRGVVEVAALRNIESIYLHVDVTNHAALAMYEKCGFHYLDMRNPIYAQFTASLNLHDGATQGRKHHLMCKNLVERLTWLEDNDSTWACFAHLY
jgi:ribosomal protein S18 acetylase RimI-like enzyme